ncbi:hypothetical protein [Pseudomonas shirazensis]|uniref:hypothetical protein n=1 Tax=Pseudomonas shirazensis TaxID=2745494 RepID=UPI003D298D6A
MDHVRELELSRIKAFYRLLVDRLGVQAWEQRKARYEARIRKKEVTLDLALPIEPQLFVPADDDIDWYILACELASDVPHSDCAYSSKRIYPFAMAIGAVAEQLRDIPNVGGVLDKMLANNNKPDTQLFELLTAAFYLKNGYKVEFLPELSLTWPDGKTKKTPDMLVHVGDDSMYVECKRAAQQTRYSLEEQDVWGQIWASLSRYLLDTAPWSIVDLTFHGQVKLTSLEEVIRVVDLALQKDGARVRHGSVSAAIRWVDRAPLERHYRRFLVRPNCPQQEQLVFGDVDTNEKRSIATIAQSIERAGSPDSILNIFLDDVASCVAAQWRCDHEISLGLRSKHFKSLINDASMQIPPDKPGVVHVLYETRDGIDIEELRSEKNLDNIAGYDASGTTVLGVLLHGVNYYPQAQGYQWAETMQYFSRAPDFIDLYPRQTLVLSSGTTREVVGDTHWAQDRASKQS